MLDKIKKQKVSSSVLVIIILLLILICSFVLFFEINNYRNITTEDHEFYYYFSSDKVDFSGTITLDVDDMIVDLKTSGISISSSPLYYKEDSDQMILPSNMEIVYPYKNNPMYKVGKYAKIYSRNNYMYINSEAGIGRLYDCFLYDGEDLYAFVEDITVMIGEDRYDLSPMSFIEVTRGYVRFYNKETDEYVFLENYNGTVEAYTEEYAVNLSSDTFNYGTSFYILIKNVDGLDFIEL